jgi:hypothetical protein
VAFPSALDLLMALPPLDVPTLLAEATAFAKVESVFPEPTLFGVTDGKAIGTYLEHKFRAYLATKYTFQAGNSASGIDFPALGVDMKVTSINQPQSSCPFKSARQKVYGLGYSLLVFVYEKKDDHENKTATLNMAHTVFVEKERTADFQMTRGLAGLLANNANVDDIVAFFADKSLPVDDIEANNLAEEVLKNPPVQGYLTISNALQWRLQYGRVIDQAGTINGVHRLV